MQSDLELSIQCNRAEWLAQVPDFEKDEVTTVQSFIYLFLFKPAYCKT